MKRIFFIIPTLMLGLILIFFSYSCCSDNSSPDEQYIPQFHQEYFSSKCNNILQSDDLSLYVDYSTCISLGQHSDFFQSLIPSFVDATKSYYAIKGPNIELIESANVFHELSNIVNVNYADLKKAANRIVQGNSEGALFTDGEYYQRNISGGGISDPYMAEAFKIWLKKGHDIYILAEPYIEKHNGIKYNKKRFYFLFTDSRLDGNIYKRICETGQLENYPQVELFHLSADHPTIMAEGTGAKVNKTLSASAKHFGSFEIQDWAVDWTSIEKVVMGAVNSETGETLPNGEPVIGGLKVDRNSYGGFKISDVNIMVYDINADYFNYYNEKISSTGQQLSVPILTHCPNTFLLDKEEFKKHGNLNIYLDTQMWTPANFLTGCPFNYTKLDIVVAHCDNIFNQYNSMFDFDAIGLPGKLNTSVTESVKQCLFDPEIQRMMNSAVLYTIYVKSNKY